MWGAALSFSRTFSTEATNADSGARSCGSNLCAQPSAVRSHMYDVVLSGEEKGGFIEAVGVHVSRDEGDVVVHIEAGAGWEDVRTGQVASEAQIKQVLASCDALLIRAVDHCAHAPRATISRLQLRTSALSRVRLILRHAGSELDQDLHRSQDTQMTQSGGGGEGAGSGKGAGVGGTAPASGLGMCEAAVMARTWDGARDCFVRDAAHLTGERPAVVGRASARAVGRWARSSLGERGWQEKNNAGRFCAVSGQAS